MLFNIVHYILYDTACTVIIPNGQQISLIVFLMTGYAIMFKLQLQSFFFLDCTAQFVSLHVPLGHVPKDPHKH